MKRKIQIILIALGVLLIAMGLVATNGLQQGRNVPLEGIDLATKADGDYTGTYSFKRWANTLVVHVQEHQITRIDILEDIGGAELTHCADETFQRVIKAQDTRVDAVSGATVTSKAYLKAIEDALK